MKVIDAEGKSIEDAIRNAAGQMGISASKIKKENIEVLDEGKSGIFGFGVSRMAKIRVTVNVETKDIGEKTREVLDNMFKLMGIEASIHDLHEGESKVYIELDSDDSGLVIGKKGKTLEAVQFLLNLIVNQQTGSDKKIILDIESYRAKRERVIKKISFEAAKKVLRSGKPVLLEPMNPFERRLVHLTLQDHDKVETKSEGQGIYRKVKVIPKDSK